MGTCKFLHLLQESPRRWAKQWCYAFILACVDVTNHVTFQSWFHDNLCSSSKGMEKPVFERNYVYIYLILRYQNISKLGSIAGSACQRANMGKSSALWALTEQILKIRL